MGLTTDLLLENNLDVSFSKVKYIDIAPKVGLDPGREGDDIPKFEIFCARLPNSVFSKILVDLQDFEWQYGPLSKHDDEEARACYLSGYFNKIVALFSGLLSNKPEAILEGKITTKRSDRVSIQDLWWSHGCLHRSKTGRRQPNRAS